MADGEASVQMIDRLANEEDLTKEKAQEAEKKKTCQHPFLVSVVVVLVVSQRTGRVCPRHS